MKAIRQDLTLQNIKDEFAAEVYESHARLALENRDYSNYKQCQASLQGLYAGVSMPPGQGGADRPAVTHALHFSQGASGNTSEFTAYSILYSVCTNRCLPASAHLPWLLLTAPAAAKPRSRSCCESWTPSWQRATPTYSTL